MQPIVTDQAAWSVGLSVCLSVCHISEPCKNSCTGRDAISHEDSGGPKNHVLDGGPDPPWEGAKMAKPIEMLFGLWAQMRSRNHVLDEVHRH